jgi:hypothetical protein
MIQSIEDVGFVVEACKPEEDDLNLKLLTSQSCDEFIKVKN